MPTTRHVSQSSEKTRARLDLLAAEARRKMARRACISFLERASNPPPLSSGGVRQAPEWLQHEVEGGAFAHRPFRPDPAAVAVHDAPGGGQADAGPWELAGAVQALERAEQPVGIDHVETDPIVLDEDAGFAVDHLAADGDPGRL